jgi:DNA-binding transcriptional ArsR family regulator
MKTVATIAGSCPPLLQQALGRKEADELAGVLKALLNAGLVAREQRGSWAYYRVEPEALGSVRALLA